MLAKFGLVLLVLVFGALAFSAGTTAPGALTQPVADAIQGLKQLAGKVVPGLSAPPSPSTAVTTVVPAAAAGAASAASSAASSAGSSPASSPAQASAQAPGAAAMPAAAAPATAPAPAPAASAADASVAMGSTLLPAMPPATASYALQAGQFASSEAAAQLSASLRGQGVTSTVITVRDAGGTYWSVVTLGQFDSSDQALSQRLYLSNKLGLPQYLPAIVLPPPPKPPS